MAGLALFIFPGVWIMINLVFAEYLLVLRGLPVVQSMRESARMTTGHFMRIMICVLAVLAPIWLIDGLLLMAFPEHRPAWSWPWTASAASCSCSALWCCTACSCCWKVKPTDHRPGYGHVPLGLARAVASATSGSSGQ